MVRLTTEEINEKLKPFGYSIVGEYNGRNNRVDTYMDADGYYYDMTFNTLFEALKKYGKLKKKFSIKGNSANIEHNIKVYIKINNIDTEFIRWEDPMYKIPEVKFYFRCKCGNECSCVASKLQGFNFRCGTCNMRSGNRLLAKRKKVVRALKKNGLIPENELDIEGFAKPVQLIDRDGFKYFSPPHNYTQGKVKGDVCRAKFLHTNEINFIYNAQKILTDSGNESVVLSYEKNPLIFTLKCKCGEVFDAPRQRIVNLTECCICEKCKGEFKSSYVRRVCNVLNIPFKLEWYISDCRDERPLPFDIYLPTINSLIEIDGMQHSKSIPLWGGEEQLRKAQKHDKIKTEYCADNNIPLLRLSYVDFSDDTWEEKLFDFINANQKPSP